MKIGSGRAAATAGAGSEESGVNSAFERRTCRRSPRRRRRTAPVAGVALGVMSEGLRIVARVLQRLAEREVEMQAVLVGRSARASCRRIASISAARR